MKKILTLFATVAAFGAFAQFQTPTFEVGAGMGPRHPEAGVFGKVHVAANEILSGVGLYVSAEYSPSDNYTEPTGDKYFRTPIGLTFRTNSDLSFVAAVDPINTWTDADGGLHMRKEVGIRYHTGPWVIQSAYGFYVGSTFSLAYTLGDDMSSRSYEGRGRRARRGKLEPRVDTVTIRDTVIQERVVEKIQIVEKEPDLTLVATVYFQFDNDQYSVASRGAVEAIVEGHKEHPTKNIVLIGHTDESGSEQYNYTLGLDRARRVANDMAKKFGIPAGRIEVRSAGKTQPKSKDDHSANRRVEIYLK